MKKQYIKNPIPEQISEDGGASVVFVNKQTVPLDGAIDEALAGNYCTGQKTLIRNFFFGLMQSMADGVRRDGHARQIANFLTVYPVFKGEVDLERGYDPEVNGVMIRARLLNEMDLDITNWSFEDVTPGKRPFRLNTVKAGEVIGEYKVGETGNLNGKDLPSTAAGEELRIHWEVVGTEKSGDVPAEKLASDVSRIDIAADALAALAGQGLDGRTVVFTVRGNFSSAKISATLRDPAPHVPTAEWEGSLGTSGGELTVGGEAGAQLAALYEDDPSAAYERVKFTDPDGEEISCPMQAADGTLAVSASVSAGCQAGDAYTLAVQVEDSAGTLVTLSHEYTVTEV